MRNEFRVGRLNGSGALIQLTTAVQLIEGLKTTLEVPKGHIALVTLHLYGATNSSWIYADLVDGGVALAYTVHMSGTAQALRAAGSYELGPGKHPLWVQVSANGSIGNVDPIYCSLEWIIAPKGGIA